MKTLRLIILAFVMTVLAVPAFAQVTINSTTLSSAVSPTANTVVLASVTCTGCTFGPGTTVYVDLEQMIVAGSYTSGTTVQVIRQKAAAHASGAVVFLGPANRFQLSDPPIGACNKTLQGIGYYPWLNINTGLEWLCDNGSATAYTTVTWRVLYPYQVGTQAASR